MAQVKAQLAQRFHFLLASTAMSNSDAPSGMWSARIQKRHAAVSRDMSMTQRRLDDLGNDTKRIDSKIDSVIEALSKLGASTHNPIALVKSEVEAVAAKVSRLEFLLFRTSLEDFKVLDKEIQSRMPTVLSTKGVNFVAKALEAELPYVPTFPFRGSKLASPMPAYQINMTSVQSNDDKRKKGDQMLADDNTNLHNKDYRDDSADMLADYNTNLYKKGGRENKRDQKLTDDTASSHDNGDRDDMGDQKLANYEAYFRNKGDKGHHMLAGDKTNAHEEGDRDNEHGGNQPDGYHVQGETVLSADNQALLDAPRTVIEQKL